MSNPSPKIIDSFNEEEMDDAKWSQLNPAWKDENEAEEHALDHLATMASPASEEASYQPPVTRSTFHNMAPTNDLKLICRPIFCQRCFLRMQYHQDHVCETIHGHKACQWCAKVHQRCIPVPGEFDKLVQAAFELTDVAQSRAIADIRRRISMRTRLLNRGSAEK